MKWLLLPAAAALLFLAGTYVCYLLTFSVPRKAAADLNRFPKGTPFEALRGTLIPLIRDAASIPYEEVSITSFDGLRLVGKYYERFPGAPVQIMFHGYRSDPVRDFAGGLPLAFDAGCNVLLVFQRGHGKSQGRCLTFGVLERRDVQSWTEYAAARFGPETPTVLVGVSMGAATVTMASDLPLPANVVGIIADCGYSAPAAIIQKVMVNRGIPVGLYPLVRLGGKLYGGFDLEESSSEISLRNCKVPVLFIHGESDHFVPCEMSWCAYDACASEKTLVTFPNAGHGLSFITDREKYRLTIRHFLDRVLKS